MNVYVDFSATYPSARIAKHARRNGRVWCHLWADTVDYLHLFARGIGLQRSWFQNKPGFPHYDVTPAMRNIAVLRGAKQTSLHKWLRERNGNHESV